MANVKVKFRASNIEGEKGVVFYQVVHERVSRQVSTAYRIYEDEWNGSLSEIEFSRADKARKSCLFEIMESIHDDVYRFRRIILSLEKRGGRYCSDDVVSAFMSGKTQRTFFEFMEETIANLKKIGKDRTSETYTATLNSFRRFRGDNDFSFDKMDSDMMLEYEAYLKARGISPNSSSFYMRILRAVYNRAVEKEIVSQQFPFRHVYTGVGKTVKRAVSINVIRQIRRMDLPYSSSLDFARDMFLFSFYTRGMSFVDMAYLRKSNLSNGVLSYRRRKTGQQLHVRWEGPMQEIVDKYYIADSIYLLPIIRYPDTDERRQYIYAAHNINRNLKFLGNDLDLPLPLTLYVARHAWASIAKSKNIPLSVISEGMGHDSESTTRIYLASLDSIAIDRANSLIINSL